MVWDVVRAAYTSLEHEDSDSGSDPSKLLKPMSRLARPGRLAKPSGTVPVNVLLLNDIDLVDHVRAGGNE